MLPKKPADFDSDDGAAENAALDQQLLLSLVG